MELEESDNDESPPPNLNNIGQGRSSFIFCILKVKHGPTLEQFITDGVDVNFQNVMGGTALQAAAKANFLQGVEILLRHGALVDRHNVYRNTPLHIAARNKNSAAVVELLIRHKADIHAENLLKYTPLHLAAQDGDIEAVNILLENGASVNARTNTGETAYHLAAARNSIEIIDKLISCGSDIHAVDSRQNNALHIAVKSKSIDVINLLVERGLDINAINALGHTPIRIAVRQDFKEGVLRFYEINAEFDLNELLHLAVELEVTSVVCLLLELNADKNSKNRFGETALQSAIENKYTDGIHILLEPDLEPIINDPFTIQRILKMSIKQHCDRLFIKIIKCAKAEPIQFDPMNMCVKYSWTNGIVILVQCSYEIPRERAGEIIALLIANYRHRTDLVRTISKSILRLEEGKRFLHDDNSCALRHAFQHVIETENLDPIKLLICHGFNIPVRPKVLQNLIITLRTDVLFKLVDLLIYSGVRIKKFRAAKFPKLAKHLESFTSQPFSLCELSRITLRRTSGRYYKYIKNGGLPHVLRSYLAFDYNYNLLERYIHPNI